MKVNYTAPANREPDRAEQDDILPPNREPHGDGTWRDPSRTTRGGDVAALTDALDLLLSAIYNSRAASDAHESASLDAAGAMRAAARAAEAAKKAARAAAHAEAASKRAADAAMTVRDSGVPTAAPAPAGIADDINLMDPRPAVDRNFRRPGITISHERFKELIGTDAYAILQREISKAPRYARRRRPDKLARLQAARLLGAGAARRLLSSRVGDIPIDARLPLPRSLTDRVVQAYQAYVRPRAIAAGFNCSLRSVQRIIARTRALSPPI